MLATLQHQCVSSDMSAGQHDHPLHDVPDPGGLVPAQPRLRSPGHLCGQSRSGDSHF